VVVIRLVALFKLEARQERSAGNQVIENSPLAPELTINPRVPDAITLHRLGAALNNVAEGGQLIQRLLDRHSNGPSSHVRQHARYTQISTAASSCGPHRPSAVTRETSITRFLTQVSDSVGPFKRATIVFCQQADLVRALPVILGGHRL
jgi:hypothetical protein